MIAHDAGTPVNADDRPKINELGNALYLRLESMGRSRSTLEAIESTVRVHLEPFFGTTPVDRIKERDLERFIADRRAAGLSPKSIRNYLGTLHSIFELGIRRGYVSANPCKLVDKPQSANDVEEIRFLTVEELDAVIAHAGHDDVGRVDRVLWLTCALTGMRMGETRGFRWQDIDWLAAKVRIRQTYVRQEFKAPKSKRSSRAVPLARRLARELELLYQETAFTGDDHLVFGHPHTGTPLDGSKALKRYKRACRAAGVNKSNRLHDLRHTFGTKLAGQGVPMRTLQEWMGHRDLATTQIYADYAPSAREAEMVAAAFARGSNRGSNLTGSQPISEQRNPANSRQKT